MDEGAGLENQWAPCGSRGFESHSLRAVRRCAEPEGFALTNGVCSCALSGARVKLPVERLGWGSNIVPGGPRQPNEIRFLRV